MFDHKIADGILEKVPPSFKVRRSLLINVPFRNQKLYISAETFVEDQTSKVSKLMAHKE